MELRQAEHFIAVVEHGSVTRAAAALHITQPSLSQSIRVFGEQLGVTLFDRVDRKLVPSEAGRAVTAQAQRLLAAAADARAAVHDVTTLAGGELRIAVHSELIVDPLAPLVGRFRREHPDVALKLVDPITNSAATRLVQNGGCDIAVTTRAAFTSTLTVKRLCIQTVFLVAADCVPLPDGDPVRISDLADVPLVLIPSSTSARDLIEESFAESGVRPRVKVECAPREAIWPLVKGGAGASFFLSIMAQAARAQGMQVRSTYPEISRDVFLVHRMGPLSPELSRFLAMVDDSLQVR